MAGCLGTGMLNKAGCDRWMDKMTEKPGLGDQKGRWWELLSTVSVSGWPDVRVIFQAGTLTWGVGKAANPRRVPNVRHPGTRKQAEPSLP